MPQPDQGIWPSCRDRIPIHHWIKERELLVSDREDPMRTTVKQVHQWATLGEQKPTKLSSRRSTCWVIAATWVATNWLLFRSLYREQTITTADAASHILMGLPFPFLYQNQTWEFGSEIGHMKIGFSAGSTHLLSPLEHPTHMIWPNYFLDLVLVWGSLLLITLLILWVIRKVRRAVRIGS